MESGPDVNILRALAERDLIADLAVERRSYSSNPWRIVTRGLEVAWEREGFHHPVSGLMTLPTMGYRTKRDAVDALGRLREALAAYLAST